MSDEQLAHVFVADLHVGSIYGLWPPKYEMDEGSTWGLTPVQQYIHECWEHFWNVWVPVVIGGRKFVVWIVGDGIDGPPFRNIDSVTQSLTYQVGAATFLLKPVVQDAIRVYYCAGTEAHTGRSAEYDELLARSINAFPDESTGRAARWMIWHRSNGVLIQAAHHVAGSFVPSSEATPLMREFVDSAVDSAREGIEEPDVLVRAHAHKYRFYAAGNGPGVITLPCWQGRAAYIHKLRRASPPHIGGVVVTACDGEWQVLRKIYRWPKPSIEEMK
jgi:hypothetical protein